MPDPEDCLKREPILSVKECEIVHESGQFWVYRNQTAYTVMRAGLTCSISVQSFEKSEAGLSLAVAYANYLANKKSEQFPSVVCAK